MSGVVRTKVIRGQLTTLKEALHRPGGRIIIFLNGSSIIKSEMAPERGQRIIDETGVAPSQEATRSPHTILHLKEGDGALEGMKGQSVILQANYFQFNTKTDLILYQYKVDFNPDIDATYVKKDVLSRIKDDFGQYLFDGTVLITTTKLRQGRF
ncbi:hypothetical protein GE061_001690 [Apolygus lucorum]|uniref:Uncharacterized protein n=1 Tax=Apolygus lucorum TaxID=248454 RepID=A0A8S9YCN5_APOLU|nr:hypothetical protein GE061_001690 [Apolygus lucorum]